MTSTDHFLCIKNMASWEPVGIDPIDHDEIGEEDDKWDDDLVDELEQNLKN